MACDLLEVVKGLWPWKVSPKELALPQTRTRAVGSRGFGLAGEEAEETPDAQVV